MKRLVVLLMSGFALCWATLGHAVTPLFILDSDGNVSTFVFRVNPATGQLTTAASIPISFGEAVGLAAASENVLYATTGNNRLLRITLNPPSVVDLGAAGGYVVGLAYSGGQLYGIEENTGQLLRIQISPLATIPVGLIRVGSVNGPGLVISGGDIAQDGAGNWYLWTNSASDLFSLDINTAVAVQLDPPTISDAKTGLAFDYQGGGVLYGSSRPSQSLERLDQATGAITASVNLCLTACPSPPNPPYGLRAGDMASPRCTDEDGDGFSPEGGPCGTVDCNPINPAVFPGAAETCNGIDDNCDGTIDGAPASASCANACTATAACVAGACVTTAIICNDGNPCTSDGCNPLTGCTFANQPNGFSCSDGNVCTGEETCSNGTCASMPFLDCSDGNTCTTDSCAPPNGCRNTPLPGCCTNNAGCADVSACTVNERCVAGQCLSDPVNCDDGNPCTSDSCNPATGCANIPVVNGISCSDGNTCNGLETCQGGACTPGATLNCNDSNPCTTDSCNPLSGCIQQSLPGCCASNANCADASACTVNERCVNNTCVSDPLPCNDGNPCTGDACSSGSGCTFTPLPNGQSCADTDFCNGAETCQSGACGASFVPDCNDANACTTDTCNPTLGCRNTPIPACCTTNANCADASACTVNERCVAGQCLSDPVNCNDGSPCTSDSCNPATGCANIPVVNGISCSDGNTCNGLETCQGGSCTPGTQLNCNDGNPCTTDSCNTLSGCVQQPLPACCATNANCADASACTVNERCVGNACLSDPRPCDDGNPCTSDSCSPTSGCSFTPVPNGQSCSDVNVCNGIETCQSGACEPSFVPDCNDGNPCTIDACNPPTGCAHTAVPSCCFTNGDCADNDACTIDARCVSGSCVTTPRNCQDANPCTADSCDPGSGCVQTDLLDGASCSDMSACDGVETCAGGACVEGTALDCDDRNFCTVDTCSNATGCVHSPVPVCCNANANCADADLCTVNERCTAQHACASDPQVCDDGDVCTDDSCNPSVGCVHTPASGDPCTDGSLCTDGDACSGGVCVGVPLDCSDGNLCNGDEACTPANGLCMIPAGSLVCTPGGRRGDRTCHSEWFIRNPTNPTGVLSRFQTCREGDPTCDFDTDAGTCTFQVAVCFHVPDPRLVPACVPTDVASFSLRRPTRRQDPVPAGALLDALGDLAGATVGGTRGQDVTFDPPIGAVRCTAEVPLTVAVGRRFSLGNRTLAGAAAVDRDSLRLACIVP